MGRLRRRLQRLFLLLVFRLLYYEANWAYALSARLASAGRWREWQRVLLPEVRGPRVLEVGCGTGWLLEDMEKGGDLCVGLDLSPAMVRKARRQAPGVPLVRADGRALPFRDATFDTVVMCFSGLSFTPSALKEAQRVLLPGGRLAVTEIVQLHPCTPLEWMARLLWGLTDTGAEFEPQESLLGAAGLKGSSRWVRVGFAEVQVAVGEKQGGWQAGSNDA